jgi:hypothetical protein
LESLVGLNVPIQRLGRASGAGVNPSIARIWLEHPLALGRTVGATGQKAFSLGVSLNPRGQSWLIESSPWTDALSDRERSERTVVLIFLAYVALWTIYGVIAKGGQDIHVDMS